MRVRRKLLSSGRVFERSSSLKYTFEPNCLVSECVFEQSLCEKGFSVPSDWKVNDDSCSALSYYLHIPQDEQPRRIAARMVFLTMTILSLAPDARSMQHFHMDCRRLLSLASRAYHSLWITTWRSQVSTDLPKTEPTAPQFLKALKSMRAPIRK